MICPTCREAADRRAPADQHCNSHGGPGAACDCAHRTDRYRPRPITVTIDGRDVSEHVAGPPKPVTDAERATWHADHQGGHR